MPLQHAYATVNKAAGLAVGAFTWSNGATTNRAYLNDGQMDRQMVLGATATQVFLTIDFGVAVALNAIASLNSNMADAVGPIMIVQAADDAAITVNATTPKATTQLHPTGTRKKDHVLQFASTTRRYWRIGWGWNGSFNLRIGEVFAGLTTALTRATQFGHGEKPEYVTTSFRTQSGGSRGHYVAGPIRSKRLIFRDLSSAERDEIEAMRAATYGGATPLLWIQQYEATSTAAAADYQDVIYGRADLPEWGWSEPDHLRFDVDDWEVRSLGRETGA